MGQWFKSAFRQIFYKEKNLMNIETIKNLNKLKNASHSNIDFVLLSYNKLTLSILLFLYHEGFVLSFRVVRDDNARYFKQIIKVALRHSENKSILNDLKIFSSPSNSSFFSYNEIVKIDSRKSLYCFSTNEGLLNSFECKAKRLGGILLFIC